MPSPATALLQSVGLFSGLPISDLDDLAHALRLRRYARGEVVCHRDDPGDSLFIIQEGVVKIGLTSPDDREVILNLMVKGDYFGELALLDGEPRSADVTALDVCRLLSLPRAAFFDFLGAHPSATAELLASMSRQVRRLTDQVYDAAFFDLQTRIARALVKLAETDALEKQTPVLHITQTQLGAMVGATRESVNKWLGSFERRHLIRRDRGSISILRLDELRTHAALDTYVAW